MSLFGLKHLIESEERTSLYTSDYLRGIAENYPRIIDLFLKLPYFTGELEDVATTVGEFQSVCNITYMQAPYTFWSLYGLYEKGYYFEAILLYRHLIEAFIQLRYFNKHQDKLHEHILQTKRVNFSAMFNEFSPGYYKKIYSKQLSEAAHGIVIFKDIHRVERSKEDKSKSRTIMGCEFNVDRATYVMNMTISLLYGYINWFNNFFPSSNIKEYKLEFVEMIYSLDWLKRAMESHKKQIPRSKAFYEHMDKFIL